MRKRRLPDYASAFALTRFGGRVAPSGIREALPASIQRPPEPRHRDQHRDQHQAGERQGVVVQIGMPANGNKKPDSSMLGRKYIIAICTACSWFWASVEKV